MIIKAGYRNTNERIGRKAFLLIYALPFFLCTFFYFLIRGANVMELALELEILFCIAWAATFIVYLIGQIKRLHDIGDSGIWVALTFLPLINILLFWYLTFAKGSKGTNEYGRNPRSNP